MNEVAREYGVLETECRSTEEMISAMEEKVNSKDDITELFVGSTDVRGLYPALLAGPTTAFVNMTREEITKLGLEELVSNGRKVGGAFPGNTTDEVMGKLYHEHGEEVASLFYSPIRQPTV